MDNTNTVGWWIFGIVVVVLIALAIWWASASQTSPGVPNTGTQSTTTTTQTY